MLTLTLDKHHLKGLFAGYYYMLYKVLIFPGFCIHQWNLQLKHLHLILYVSKLPHDFEKNKLNLIVFRLST